MLKVGEIAEREKLLGRTIEVVLLEVWKMVGYIAGVGVFAGGVVAEFEVRSRVLMVCKS